MKKIYAKIFLSDGTIETINYGRLVSCETNNIGVNDTRFPSYGIVLPTGRIEFKDADEIFLAKLNNDLGHNAKVKFYISDTSKGTERHISTFIAGKWEYDKENKVVQCPLSSQLEQTKNKIFSISELEAREQITEMTLEDLFYMVTQSDDLTKNIYVDANCSSTMGNTIIQFPFIEKDKSIWYHIDQFCKVIGAYCFVGYDNEAERFELKNFE